MAFSIEIKGLRELQARFNDLPKHLQKEASAIVEAGAKTWVRNAKRDCTAVDNGFLRNGISYAQSILDKTRVSFEIVSNAHYSPYIEWGTVTKVDVPAELSDYAIQFKGKGLIKDGGIRPQPFFFKQMLPVKQQVEKGIASLLEEVSV